MRTVIAFRVTEQQHQILETAEQIIQKPRCEILARLVDVELVSILKKMVAAGAKPRPFAPPKQRLQRRKGAADAQDNPC